MTGPLSWRLPATPKETFISISPVDSVEAQSIAIRAAVVISTYDSARWNDLVGAIASARAQTLAPCQVVVVVDHNEALLRRVRSEIDGILAIGGLSTRGASAARNAGAAASESDVIAFLDDDAVAERHWLATLCGHLRDGSVIGAGGRTILMWPAQRPRWFPSEYDWVVGGSYRGVADEVATVRNVWSSNMVVRRSVFDRAGGFRLDFGKVGARRRPEDTELCIRAVDLTPGGRWVYDPSAIVRHRVTEDRIRLKYFVRRCFNEGLGKAELAGVCGVARARQVELDFIRNVVFQGLKRELGAMLRQRDREGFTRSAAICGGLMYAVAGYCAGRMRLANRRRRERLSRGVEAGILYPNRDALPSSPDSSLLSNKVGRPQPDSLK